jgi:hypothetical protein
MCAQFTATLGAIFDVLLEDGRRDVAQFTVDVSGDQILLADLLLDPGH